MAKSYYKFDKRPDKVTVDWGAISKDFSTRLSEERNRREDLKSEIAEDTKKYLRTVQDTPQGQNQSANDRMASFAEAATKTRLMQEQKLKSGELKLRDYYAQKANLEQGTTDLFEVAKNFNTNFEKNMQRANTNASQVEIWNNGRMQDFANPAKSQIIVDPETGEVLVAKVVDGVPSNTDIASVFSLKSGVNQEIDRVDVKDWASKTLDTYKEDFQQVLASGGSVTSKLENPKFKEAIDKDVAAKLKTGSYTAASVLADNTDKEYTFSTDEKDRGKDGVIMMIPNPQNPGSGVLVPDLTEAQEKEASKVLKDSILGRLSRKETPAPKVTATEINLADRNKQREVYIGYTTDLVSGTPQEFDTAANILISQFNRGKKKGEDKISDIKRLSDGIEITYENQSTGEMRTVPIKAEGKGMEALVIEVANLTTPIDLGTSISEYSFDDVMFNPEASQVSKGVVESDDLADMYISVSGTAKPVVEMFEGLSSGKDFAALARRILAEKVRGKIVNVDNKGTWAGSNRKIVIDIDGVKTEIPYDSESYINNMTNMQAFLDKLEGVEVKPAAEGKKKLPGT